MESIKLDDFDQDLPDKLPVSVVMEKRPSSHQWVDFTYQAVEVIAGEQQLAPEVTCIHQQDGLERFLYTGLNLQLHVDQCESYYHNLMVPDPGCYVVAGNTEQSDEIPRPYLVTLSFDEAHAYLEGDELVYSVAIPEDLYRWCEAYILTHYEAIQKTKRKRKNWKQQAQGSTGSQ